MLLNKLSEINGTSGNEQKVRAFIKKEISKYLKDVKIDKYGNLIARKKGKGPKVMLTAHMDEIGLMVRGINDKGFLYCLEIGGIEAMPLVGQIVKIKANGGDIRGVITLPEISDDETVEEVPIVRNLMIDTGLTKKELQKKGIVVGSFVNLHEESMSLGKKNIIAGKALDDRVGCYILLELARKLKKVDLDLYYVFTVQEEVGLYGSKTSVETVNPDWAIVVDVTPADDTREHPHITTKALGKGPTITVKDEEVFSNTCLVEHTEKLAKKKNIPFQIDVGDIGTTDALSISVAKGGIPTITIGVAVRNIHTTMGIASMKDIENAIKLIAELLKKPPKKCVR